MIAAVKATLPVKPPLRRDGDRQRSAALAGVAMVTLPPPPLLVSANAGLVGGEVTVCTFTVAVGRTIVPGVPVTVTM